MKSEKYTKLLFFLSLIAMCYYGYIAYYYSLYSLGLFLIPMVFILAGAGSIIVGVMSKLILKQRFQLFAAISIVLFTALIIEHHLNAYKPTKTIHVPENYNGLVHIFPAKLMDADDFYADENGMLYFYAEREVNIKILHGARDITNANNEYGRFSLNFYSEDSLLLKSLDAYCFRAEEGREYPDSPWNQFHESCLTQSELETLISQGLIDTSMMQFDYSK